MRPKRNFVAVFLAPACGAGYAHEATGLYVDASAFLDRARNDYVMGALAPDAAGRPQPVRVARFHDAYGAEGGSLELGVRNQPWAKRLFVRGYASENRREIQHDLRVTRAEGEDRIENRTAGLLARYAVDLGPSLELNALALYANNRTQRSDPDRWVYDWFGRRVAAVRLPRPVDNLFLQHDVYTRATLAAQLHAKHELRFAVTPAATFYSGENRTLPSGALDPLAADQRMVSAIGGIEYQADLFADRLQNIAFAKAYFYRVDSTSWPRVLLQADGELVERADAARPALREGAEQVRVAQDPSRPVA